jgi:general secretion pathway protein K
VIATSPAARSSGFALILVLWFLVLIAALATYLMANARSETAIARNIRAAAIAEALADGAVAQAVFDQVMKSTADRWKLDGEPHLLVLVDGEATIRLYDEKQKINPNHASDGLMAGFFEAAGVERTLARRLGASIADWVDLETEPRHVGAEMQQYIDAGRSYGPPNAPVENIDELQLVLGMTPELLALVRPYFTIHTQSGEPEGNNASLVVRRALALAARASSIDAGAEGESTHAGPTGGVSNEDVVRVVVTARASTSGVFVRDAVLQLDSTNPKGYVVLDWRRGGVVD